MNTKDAYYSEKLKAAIEEIQGKFPDEPEKQLLNKKEVQKATGLSYNGVNKLFKFNKLNMISVVTLAAQMIKQ